MAPHPNPQFHPMEINPTTGEPFLRLESHPNIIITPTRPEDAPRVVELLSDKRVYGWLCSPPHPYLPEHAHGWLQTTKSSADDILAQLEAAKDDTELKTVDGCPVRSIREVREDGTDVFLGDIGFMLSYQTFELEPLGRTKQDAPRRDPERPDVWSCGDYLAPSHHGLGIMSDAFGTVLRKWGIPRMGVKQMVVSASKGNQGSVRVFEKNGFKLRDTYPDALVVRGILTSVHVLDWTLE
ncbi:unnamed protein product [Mycena citricolor]|uniref:N-acetyltransferase domain-containing protein n=1 Tax=Mycena citricolor TaxID=2018698 RepID=A0AAD2HQY8_9AGAR|nr:unnamed protein product [Mycena citricolor]